MCISVGRRFQAEELIGGEGLNVKACQMCSRNNRKLLLLEMSEQ